MVMDKYNKESLSIEVIKNVAEFYTNNKMECDKNYKTLNKDISGIYEAIDDRGSINDFIMNSSILILTANRFEQNVLHVKASEDGQVIYKAELESVGQGDRQLLISAYFFDVAGYHIFHLTANQTGSYTMGGSADLVRLALKNEYCFPDVVISFGVCFGNDYRNGKQRIGDTIIAKKIYPYFISAKVGEDNFTVEDNNIFEVDRRLSLIISDMFTRGYLNEDIDRAFFNRVITGEAVISNELIKQIFIKASAGDQKVYGGEMEGYGLFKECRGYEYSVKCLLIKAICDWGSIKNIDSDTLKEQDLPNNFKDILQAFAAYRAYEILLKILKSNKPRSFSDSIYDELKDKIRHEHINNALDSLAYKEIKDRIIHLATTRKGTDDITDKYIDKIIGKMISESLLCKHHECDDVYEVMIETDC